MKRLLKDETEEKRSPEKTKGGPVEELRKPKRA